MNRAAYRIIDANFNRAREALRVIEDYCRFALDSQPLCSRAKQLRHDLSNCISKLNAEHLITSRDTIADVGIGVKVDKQLHREGLEDCVTAACKRLTEALRVLAEVMQAINPACAAAVEEMRYSAYTLEKDIALMGSGARKFGGVKLYVIISSNLPSEILSLASRCVSGGADCIQLRAKNIEDDRLFATAVEFVQICRAGDVLSIINDRADIAIAAGADGVHLGQNDLPVEQVRKLQTSPLIIGKSTHSMSQLLASIEQRPTYVALGPAFPSPTKPGVETAGIGYIKDATEKLVGTGVREVAIGGINLDNLQEVLRAGARAVAVCSAITGSDDVAAACRRFKEKIAAFGRD